MNRPRPAALAKGSKWDRAFEEGKAEDDRRAAERAALKKAKAAEAAQEPEEPKGKGRAKGKAGKAAPGQNMAKAEAPKKVDKAPKEKPNTSNYAGQATIEVAANLQRAYDFFNIALFGSKLSPMMIRLEPSKKFAGCFSPDRWSRMRGDEVRIDELVLNPLIIDGRTDRDILSTLVHEMAHGEIERQGNAPRKPYHCKRWCELMNNIGLEPVIVNAKGVPTGKSTGKNATHKIIDGGAFDDSYKDLISKGYELKWLRLPDPVPVKSGKKKPKTIGTHVCPECDEKAKAKIIYKLNCGICNVPMECNDVPEVEGEEEQSDG